MAGTALLLLILIIFFLKGSKILAKFRLTKKLAYILVAAYTILLLVAAISVEIYEKNFARESPDTVIIGDDFDGHFIADITSVDPSSIIDKRTHTAGERLIIKTDSVHFNEQIVIERKGRNDGTIEEIIHKPLLISDGYDFSNHLKYSLPIWKEDTVIFPNPPETILRYSTFRDAILISHFTGNPIGSFTSHSGMSRQIVVHLLVPKDLIIEADDEELDIRYVGE